MIYINFFIVFYYQYSGWCPVLIEEHIATLQEDINLP